jgi:tetratricopeptide (TPR) repeat protein
VKEEWTAAYWEQVNTGKVRLIPVLLGDCAPPAILANKKYCDLRTNQLEGMRQLKAELLRDAPPPVSDRGAAAGSPYFIGREAELSVLKERLSQPGAFVPVIGMPGLGKTYLAREFIRRHGTLFEAVYELDCQKKNLAALTGELASQLALRLEGDADQVAADLRRYLAAKRCLLLLDNVDDDQPGALAPGGRAAVLATARDGSIPFLAEYEEMTPPLFTDGEALELFRRVLGEFPVDKAKQLFAKLGNLPMAIAVAAGLIKHDLHYTVDSLAASLPPLGNLAVGKNNVGRLLADAIAALSERERQLLRAMAACAPAGVRLPFAAEVASLEEGVAVVALQGLYTRSLVVEIDRGARRYRLHPLIRKAPTEAVRKWHGELVREHLRDWRKSPLRHAEFLEEAEQAVRILADSNSETVVFVALEAGNLARALGRLTQAYEFYLLAEAVAAQAGRSDWLQVGIGNQALILQDLGLLDEAMALHKKQEAICQELGDRAGLQASYGNQAAILLKKQQAINEELGDLSGLRRTYSNQPQAPRPPALPDPKVIKPPNAALLRAVDTRQPQLKLFLSYSHRDEKAIEELRKDLKLMERNGLIRPWSDHALTVGEPWEARILQELNEADIIVCQLSRDFLASDFCVLKELETAIQRKQRGEAELFAYVLKDCGWKEVPNLAKFQILPAPLPERNRHKYWRTVAEELQRTITKLRESPGQR